MDIFQQPHPYIIHNKDSVKGYDARALIFKTTEENILYFRLTNQDFVNGYKT